MNISWVVSDDIIADPTINLNKIKSIGSLWGGWKTYRSMSTDNVICYDNTKAQDLIKGEFQNMCNFYIHQSCYEKDSLPKNVKLFGGEFSHELTANHDEIIALHIAQTISDIVLLLGFNLSVDGFARTGTHYRGLIYEAIKNSDAQFVLVDHPEPIEPLFEDLDNLTTDSLSAIVATAT